MDLYFQGYLSFGSIIHGSPPKSELLMYRPDLDAALLIHNLHETKPKTTFLFGDALSIAKSFQRSNFTGELSDEVTVIDVPDNELRELFEKGKQFNDLQSITNEQILQFRDQYDPSRSRFKHITDPE